MSLLDRIEAAAAGALLALLRRLDPATSSNLAGCVAAAIGPLLPVSRVAHANLQAAMPEFDAAARRRIVRGVWEQLGRTIGEFPHLGGLERDTPAGPGWMLEGEEVLDALAVRGGPAIFFSGHIGNWEILPRVANLYGMPVAGMYRAARNERVDALVGGLRERATGETVKLFPKGAKGARQAVAHLARGGFLAMLIDQKLNDGIEATLFGLPAMTAPSAASFALHFRCPVIPAVVRRVGPARLCIKISRPLELPESGSRAADILVLTQTVNDVLEGWIRELPEAWLWLHRRWPKTVVRP